MANVCLFRTCDQILRINSINVSHADKATILHLLRSATKPLRLVSSVVIIFCIRFSLNCIAFILWMTACKFLHNILSEEAGTLE